MLIFSLKVLNGSTKNIFQLTVGTASPVCQQSANKQIVEFLWMCVAKGSMMLLVQSNGELIFSIWKHFTHPSKSRFTSEFCRCSTEAKNISLWRVTIRRGKIKSPGWNPGEWQTRRCVRHLICTQTLSQTPSWHHRLTPGSTSAPTHSITFLSNRHF